MKPAIFILSILISLTISNAQDSAQKLQAQQMSHTVKELQAKIAKLDKLIQKLQFQVLNQEVGAVPGEALSVEIAASWRRRAGKYLSKKGISHRGVTQCGSPASDHIGCNAVLFWKMRVKTAIGLNFPVDSITRRVRFLVTCAGTSRTVSQF